jgi:hypothetical protein
VRHIERHIEWENLANLPFDSHWSLVVHALVFSATGKRIDLETAHILHTQIESGNRFLTSLCNINSMLWLRRYDQSANSTDGNQARLHYRLSATEGARHLTNYGGATVAG